MSKDINASSTNASRPYSLTPPLEAVSTCNPTASYNEFERMVDLPEHRLLRAILARAIFDCLAIAKDVKQSHRIMAVAFILNDSREPWSYLWICDYLYLDAIEIRKIISSLVASTQVVKANAKAAEELFKSILPLL